MGKESDSPKYAQITSELLQQILEANRFPNRCLPSERVLGEQFGVSRITIRRALSELEQEGVLYRVQGKGAFIRDEKIPQPLARLSCFSDDMENRHMKPGSRILALETVTAGRAIASRLRILPEESVVMLKRLRTADGTPMCIETCYLAPQYGTVVADRIADNLSLYHLLSEACGVTPAIAQESIEVVALKPYEISLLNAEASPYALFITRLTFDSDGQPVEYVESKYRGDRYRFETELTLR